MDAKTLRKKLTHLWNPRHIGERDFEVDISTMDWCSKPVAGTFLTRGTRRELWEAYCRANAIRGPRPDAILVVSPEEDDLGNYLHTAIHEFAHCVRHVLSPLYPYPSSVSVNVDDVLETFTAIGVKGKGRIDSRIFKSIQRSQLKRWDKSMQLLKTLKLAIFPIARKGKKKVSLFGNYALSERQYDSSHDPLFYLIFYLLDRKAHDSGFYEHRSKPKRSRTF